MKIMLQFGHLSLMSSFTQSYMTTQFHEQPTTQIGCLLSPIVTKLPHAAIDACKCKHDKGYWASWWFSKVILLLWSCSTLLHLLLGMLASVWFGVSNTFKYACHRKLLGHGLSLCTSAELQEIESQLVQSLCRIREKKVRELQPEQNMVFFIKFSSGCHENMG